MPKAIRIHKPGGPEVMQWEEVPALEPKEGEVLIKHAAIGVNFIDIYYRNGTYKAPEMPFTPGVEAVGVVIRLGKGVKNAKVGDRVAYCMGPLGAYSEYRCIPEKFLVRIPGGLANEQVAATFLKGMTAHFLLRRTYIVNDQTTMLVHAAAGGVGNLLVQWGRYLGAKVIGTVGSDDKKKMVEDLGAALVINYKTEDVLQKIKDFTGGKGVNVVYDGIGKTTFETSLNSLGRFGMFVSYGQASGPVPPVDLGLLRDKGSLFMTRPTLFDYKADADEYAFSAVELFDMILARFLRLHVHHSYKLEDAAQALMELEQGKTKGSVVLVTG
ncbi:zinc-binding dehydrogenase [bacterium]|nr:zinc-binding dehydrogenase [bacterium]